MRKPLVLRIFCHAEKEGLPREKVSDKEDICSAFWGFTSLRPPGSPGFFEHTLRRCIRWKKITVEMDKKRTESNKWNCFSRKANFWFWKIKKAENIFLFQRKKMSLFFVRNEQKTDGAVKKRKLNLVKMMLKMIYILLPRIEKQSWKSCTKKRGISSSGGAFTRA